MTKLMEFHLSQSQEVEAGTIEAILEPMGLWQVEFRGSYWTAEANYPFTFALGDIVRVVGLNGIYLLIEPITPTA
jgi:membrane protein implicated in regulation of membrane protease activity